MKVRVSWCANWIIIFFCVCSFACPTIFADERKDKEESSDAWVVEVEPGIKRYGKKSKFAEIGQSNGFDIAPDGETIAFVASGAIKFWDIDSNKVSAKINDAQASLAKFSSDGLRLYVASYGGTDNVVKIYNAITHEVESGLKLTPSDDDAVKSKVLSVDVERNSLVTAVPTHFHVQGMAVSPNDERVVVTDGNNFVLFNSETGEQLARKKVSNYVRNFTFVEDGTKFVDTNGNMYSSEDGESVGRLPKSVFPQWMQSLSVNPKKLESAAYFGLE